MSETKTRTPRLIALITDVRDVLKSGVVPKSQNIAYTVERIYGFAEQLEIESDQLRDEMKRTQSLLEFAEWRIKKLSGEAVK